jgi:hypothetical protein
MNQGDATVVLVALEAMARALSGHINWTATIRSQYAAALVIVRRAGG